MRVTDFKETMGLIRTGFANAAAAKRSAYSEAHKSSKNSKNNLLSYAFFTESIFLIVSENYHEPDFYSTMELTQSDQSHDLFTLCDWSFLPHKRHYLTTRPINNLRQTNSNQIQKIQSSKLQPM